MDIDKIKMLAWSIDQAGASEESISKAESILDTPIPEPLRSLVGQFDSFSLKSSNNSGRYPHLLLGGREYDVSIFLGVASRNRTIVDEYLSDDIYASGAIVPFARDAFGNYYFWSKVSGGIFFIDHDGYGEFDGPQKMFESMSDFFQAMSE